MSEQTHIHKKRNASKNFSLSSSPPVTAIQSHYVCPFPKTRKIHKNTLSYPQPTHTCAHRNTRTRGKPGNHPQNTAACTHNTSTQTVSHTHANILARTHRTSAVCLILSVWVPSASFCSLLHSAVLSFSTTALTLSQSHYYPIHPLPPIPLPLTLSLISLPSLVCFVLFSPIFLFFYIISFLSFLIYPPSFLSAALFLPLTSVALFCFFFFC